MTHDELRELTGLYALGALTGAERTEFEVHLAFCPSCMAEVQSLLPAAAALSAVVPRMGPPAVLRRKVLQAVEASAGNDAPVAVSEIEGTPTLTVSPAPRARMPVWLALAASLVAAVGVSGYALSLRSRVVDLEGRLLEATRRADETGRQVADARRALDEAQSSVAILAAPDLARIDLAGQPAAPNARARAFWSRSRGLVFTASDLPPLPPGKTYQLWVVTAGAPIDAGVLTPDASGNITVVINTSPDLPQPVAMAVTIEPAGGVPAPTGEKYLVGVPA